MLLVGFEFPPQILVHSEHFCLGIGIFSWLRTRKCGKQKTEIIQGGKNGTEMENKKCGKII